ncbi:hypothetical protein CK203_056316 [Vitis vinifera]|uniref:MULE transposase domain-containing protein n=1 Tax=Vitis vinifera TaxID=29760 RepID=A0A438GNY1_VITVI|nr:hypothetical protein CK203_056316 [Vitis vinifera]
MEEEMFCYIHEGGELVKTVVGSVEYKAQFNNDVDIVKMFKFNDMFCCAYVFQCIEGDDGFICPTSAPTPIVASNSTHVSSIGELPLHMSNKSPTIESFGFSQRCAETNIVQLQLSRFEHSIVGDSNIVQVHTFQNLHNHCLEDVALSQPLDFVRQHGIQLTYLQAWQLKEKAKERIYGKPKNYYKLLAWMWERMLATNLGSSVELSYSDDDHFEQLFVAHSISIKGISTAYDANDSMFPLAFGVMSSENYEDWLWFLEKLKIVVGNMEVIIISDRHPALLRSVLRCLALKIMFIATVT